MKNRKIAMVAMLACSMACTSIIPNSGAMITAFADAMRVENGVVDFARGQASITIEGNEGQSLEGKEFVVYKLFNAQSSVGGQSINYTLNATYKAALQNVIGDKLGKTPSAVTQYDMVDYIQTLNTPDGTAVGRYSDFRYFVEDLRDEIVSLGLVGDEVSVDSVSATNTITLSGLEYGYYLVDEVTDTNDNHSASSLCMVDTANPTATFNIKSDYPTVTKKIQEDDNRNAIGNDGWNDMADYEIGQTVPYMYTSNIPNMNGYKEYYYAWHDVMDEALTFDANSVEIFITDGTREYKMADSEFKVTENPDAGTTFKVEVEDIKAIIDREFNNIDSKGHNTYGQTVTLTYNATLNDKAALDTGRPGFENDVRLEFSNDADSTGEGTTGYTPWDTVVCFTYKLDVLKTSEDGVKLEGAKFRLYSDEACTDEISLKAGNGGYIVVNDDSKPTSYTEMTSDAEGNFVIFGLDSGVYYLKETEAPAGYRLLLDPIKVTVDATFVENRDNYIKGDGATDKALVDLDYTAVVGGETDNLESDVVEGVGNLTVINNGGSKLPVTGSAATLLLVGLGAGAMTVATKLARKKEDEE